MSTSKTQSLPELPPDTKGAPAAFHAWCTDELRRRRARDLELDERRYVRASRVVLSRLGVVFPEDSP